MSLVVENGQGLANADSYVSVAEADAYYASHSSSTAWGVAQSAAKEKALLLATRFVDVHYGARWIGQRANQDQGLDWPRSGAFDPDGYLLDSVVPIALRRATAEAAFRSVAGEDLLADLDNPAAVKRYTAKVGPIEETTEYALPNGPTTQYQVIDGLVRKLVCSSSELRRA